MSWLSIPENVYLHCAPVDFRKSINGLALIVEQELRRSPFEPAVFVFCNRGFDKLKALYWDKTGFALWYKRLERDRFKWPSLTDAKAEQLITAEQFEWLLAGYDIVGHAPIYFKTTG